MMIGPLMRRWAKTGCLDGRGTPFWLNARGERRVLQEIKRAGTTQEMLNGVAGEFEAPRIPVDSAGVVSLYTEPEGRFGR